MVFEIEEVLIEGVLVWMLFNLDFCVDCEQILIYGGILMVFLDSVFGFVNFVVIEGVSMMVMFDFWVDYF